MVTWGGVTTLGPNSTSASTPKTPQNVPATPTNTANAGSTPGGGFNFGTPQSSNKTASTPMATPGTSAFGGSTGGGLFGAPAAFTTTAPSTPSTGLFGAPAPSTSTPTGLFGAPATSTTSTGLFGAPSPSISTGLFGAPATSAPSTSTGLFGAPAPSTGLLGASQTPSAGLFGNTTTGTPSSLFSSTSASNLYINNIAQPQLQVISSTGGNLESSLRNLRAYDPVASAFHHTPSPFQHIFYDPGNTPPNPPQNVDLAKWSQAVALNPDPTQLTPVPTIGAESLLVRINQQQQKANSLKSIVSKLHDTIDKDIKPRLAQSQLSARHCQTERRDLERRLLYVMRKVELLRCMNLPIQEGETQAKSRLDTLSKTLSNINQLVNEIHQFSSNQSKLPSYSQEYQQQHEWTEEEKSNVYKVLKEQQNGLESLSKIVKRDVRDMEIAKKQIKEFESKIGLPRNF